MSNSDPRLNRSRVPLILTDAEGVKREYQTRPLSDADMDEINSWLRSEYMERVEQSLANVKSEVMIRVACQSAADVISTLDMLDGRRGSAMVATVDGLARVLWQSMRQDAPELTHNHLKRLLMTDSGNVSRGQLHWTKVNLGGVGKKKTPGKPEPGEPEPTERSKKDRKRRRRRKSTGR